MKNNSNIFVAGGRGMVGSSIIRNLSIGGYKNIISPTSDELDLRDQQATSCFFRNNKIDYVFLVAAKVGGILANASYKAEFIYDNLMIQNNVIHQSMQNNVKKLLFLGSSCIYPKKPKLPISENELLQGELEKTNDAYAIAKIAGIKMCQSYQEQYGFNAISAMPTNLYGENDNFDLKNSHVIPALIRKFYEAKKSHADTVECWGTGQPMREFLYVDDLADACVFLMKQYSGKSHVNIGTGKDISIRELSELISNLVGYDGDIVWDKTKPDGTYRKLLDVKKINSLGWYSSTSLEEGLKKTIKFYDNIST
tara:strand:+ start:4964 stop:5893 length:930 start_codon:yes stop_codon:yes gene_type:complete